MNGIAFSSLRKIRFRPVCNSVLVLHRALDMGPELLDQLPLSGRCASDGQVLAMVDGDRGAPGARVAVDNDAAGLGEDDPAGADVPRPASALPVYVECALGDGAQIQRRRSERACAVHHRTPFLLAAA